MRATGVALLSIVLLLGLLAGCRAKIKVMYSFQDVHVYPVPHKVTKDFAKRLEDWCAANGYGPGGAADFPVFARTSKTLDAVKGAELVRVRYLDPALKTGGVLLTLEHLPDRKDVLMVGFYTNREGTQTQTDKQKPEIEKLQAEFEAAFPELK